MSSIDYNQERNALQILERLDHEIRDWTRRNVMPDMILVDGRVRYVLSHLREIGKINEGQFGAQPRHILGVPAIEINEYLPGATLFTSAPLTRERDHTPGWLAPIEPTATMIMAAPTKTPMVAASIYNHMMRADMRERHRDFLPPRLHLRPTAEDRPRKAGGERFDCVRIADDLHGDHSVGDNFGQDFGWIADALAAGEVSIARLAGDRWYVHVVDDPTPAEPGDWIMRDLDTGEFSVAVRR